MITIRLNNLESAALEVLAQAEGITPEHLLRDLIRDAAIFLVTGRPRRVDGDIKISTFSSTEDSSTE